MHACATNNEGDAFLRNRNVYVKNQRTDVIFVLKWQKIYGTFVR